ncbi:2-phosphosulfolactate phosphatase [Aneurinibacillus sp. Ricciae_BoGa-3]|uniref:2-phosphosulfolactate phosphatase n=1 Tax=Aneurinibacillus sp. Ricciae_BoGa-3 TaxID=3022697 RepID=UPI002341209D|nr:2-phosphosulfolactate phosphatase [Aneurinibacillus sp. Ricciae_BoGa-3]WCK54401.1 2-phosphosulfolactate phosphatase [Aneurinibacillus sp. Ricciae_BoGa-3]
MAMGKLHVVLRKEDIDEVKIQCTTAVVLDILLATSTITSGLFFGAKEFIPVLDGEEGLRKSAELKDGENLLVGEYAGITLDGFLSPNPAALQPAVGGKGVILSTTNGTVAIRKCASAQEVYIASLLNAEAVARHINSQHGEDTLVIVCSGSSSLFSLEDFYGAGYLLHCIQEQAGSGVWDLTDAAQAALGYYTAYQEQAGSILLASRVGQMIANMGYEEEVRFAARKSVMDIVPYLDGERVILK